MSMGICDVKDCFNDTYMGWNGYQICEEHWEEHKDILEEFDLHEAMGYHPNHGSVKRVRIANECCDCVRFASDTCDGARKMCKDFRVLPSIDDGSKEYYRDSIRRYKISLDI